MSKKPPEQTVRSTSSTQLDPSAQAHVNAMRTNAREGARWLGDQNNPLIAGINDQFNMGLGGLNQDLSGLGPDLSQYMTQIGPGQSAQDLQNQKFDLSGVGGMNFQASQMDPNRAAAFMNPYEQQVVGAMHGQFDRQRQGAMTAAQQQATAGGAFGGSRGEVLMAQGMRDVNNDEASQISALRNQGFAQAQNLAANEWGQMEGNNLQAQIAAMQGGIAAAGLGVQQNMGFAQMGQNDELQRLGLGVQQGLGFAGLQQHQDFSRAQMQQTQAQNQMQAGEHMRQIQQAQMQEPLMRYQEQQKLMNAGMGPYGTRTAGTQTMPQQQQPWYQRAAGGAMTGYGVGGPWGAAAGGILGILGG